MMDKEFLIMDQDFKVSLYALYFCILDNFRSIKFSRNLNILLTYISLAGN
jgi:hypothetical protein